DCVVVCFSFFFFQAEDGIRDPLVTGVQTCALPICLDGAGNAAAAPRAAVASGGVLRLDRAGGDRLARRDDERLRDQSARRHRGRSQESRVGKEGRARRAPEREKEEEGYR